MLSAFAIGCGANSGEPETEHGGSEQTDQTAEFNTVGGEAGESRAETEKKDDEGADPSQHLPAPETNPFPNKRPQNGPNPGRVPTIDTDAVTGFRIEVLRFEVYADSVSVGIKLNGRVVDPEFVTFSLTYSGFDEEIPLKELLVNEQYSFVIPYDGQDFISGSEPLRFSFSSPRDVGDFEVPFHCRDLSSQVISIEPGALADDITGCQ